MAEPVLVVALATPLRTLFDYLPPADLPPDALRPGQRLWVPFGRRRCCGLLVAIKAHSDLPRRRLKRAQALIDRHPLVSTEHLAFLQWVADYYHHPPGEVFMAALPVTLRKGKAAKGAAPNWVCLKPKASVAAVGPRAKRRRALLQWLQERGGCASLARVRRRFPTAPALLRILQREGLVERRHRPEGGQESAAGAPIHPLNSAQRAAVEAVTLDAFGAWLLDGVTGSGKTEVYLHLARRVLAQGRSVLLLVPEIALTPQLVSRFKGLGVPMALLHSARADGEREHDWLRAARGEARLVVGTRSAVLAPIPELGLVLVDEEHDPSYKQQEGIRYSARDLALVRGRRAGCPVVLGSATPSLESLHNVARGRYRRLVLKERAGGARPPTLHLLDVRGQRLTGGLSPRLIEGIEFCLAEGQQALLFLNRRGYAPVLSCYHCGWLSDCPRCDARQTYHRYWSKLICHHCGSERPAPATCPACGSTELHPLGRGTEQLEQVLKARFPQYPLVRIDRDTTSRKGSLERLLDQVRRGEPGLLVGTQMLAKGHHFPKVSLVAMVDLDAGLFSADFRAAERMAQLVVQVAGRAGRGEHPGLVLLQTRYPDHPLLQTLVNQGYGAFAQAALAERREAELPPFSHQVLVRASAGRMEAAMIFLRLAQALAQPVTPRPELLGPVPAPMPRRAGRYRAQLLLQARDRRLLHRFLDRWIPQVASLPEARRVRWSLEVDPLDLY